MNDLKNLKIQRCYRRIAEVPVELQLHIFTDARQLGFGAAAYLRLAFLDGGVEVAFLMAKTHIAPLKQWTFPQLELKGACEGVDLATLIATELHLNKTKTTYHTDSQTVLQWINSQTCKFDVFTGN